MFTTIKFAPLRKALCFAVLLLLLLVLLPGCTGKNKTDQPKEETAGKIADFFPIRENTKYVYEGAGNEFAGYDVYIDYASKDKIQQRINNGGTVTARVYEIKDGKLTMKLSKGETYYRENMLDRKGESEEVMLMEPLVKGTAWSLKDGSKRTIAATDTEVAAPMGTYRCIEVVTEFADGSATTQYYAKDAGLVKSIFRSGGAEVTSTLKSMVQDAAGIQVVRLYVPDIKNGKIYYEEREVSYHTNDFTGKILETACKDAINKEFSKALSDRTVVNSLTLDDRNIVRIDFNASLAADMNAVPDYETVILQCIADTLGYYYNSESVIVTVDGKPYRSEHISMAEGQAISVKLEGITEKII